MQKSNFQLVNKFNQLFQREKLDELADLKSKEEQDKLRLQLKLIEEEVDELQTAILEGDWEGMKDAVADILVVTYGMGYVMNIDCDKALQEVNRANMSKICNTEAEVNGTVLKYNELGLECSVVKVGDSLWAVKSAKDQSDSKGNFFPKGKFLKNINWQEPDLGFIEM
tara:strand:+ start:21272 stop:21775 length:504 start_codon:yes stop_codon:yes gene_type:complete